jgi:selenocysteine lyase/cysteine desulfurase
LTAGLDYLAAQGMEGILEKERALARRLWEGLAELGKVKLYGADRMDRRLGVILANVEGMIPADVAAILDGDFGIATRAGLHCAPLVHRRLGTGRTGGVRFSLGPFNTSEDIDRVLEAMAKICATR